MGNNKKRQQKARVVEKREVDVYFDEFHSYFRDPINRVIQYVTIPVFSFAVLGLIWMIPFPEIDFLKRHGYDTFLNWGSFFIAGIVYFYLRLATTLSYAVLLMIGLFSFFIVQLEYIEQTGGPALWFICSILLIASFLALYLGKRMEKNPIPFRVFLRLLVLGPIWIWHFVFRKLKIPY